MDSLINDYEQLWVTSSLRGSTVWDLNVEAGQQGYHSGEVGGIIPETFRVLRVLLSRVDDPITGMCEKEFQTEIPLWAQLEAKRQAATTGD